MDKGWTEAAANQAKGAIKETAVKMTDNAKLEEEGAADWAQNTIGGAKEAMRGALKH